MFAWVSIWNIGNAVKYLLKKIVTKSSVWEVTADSVSEAIQHAEAGTAKQIGWEQSETVTKVISEASEEDRPLVERRKGKDLESA